MVLLILAGTAAFSGLALLMAGTLRPEATLAAANLVYLVLLGVGGVVFPLTKFPASAQPGLRLLPTGALSDGLRTVLQHGGGLPLRDLARAAGLGDHRDQRDRAGVPLGVGNGPAGVGQVLGEVRRKGLLGAVPPPALVLSGIVSVQVGAGLAAKLFSVVPPAAVTGVRLWTAALIMAALGARGLGRALRGLVRRRAGSDAAVVVAFGLTLAVMNFAIYQSFARIPLGIAVTVEFLGPLAVAVAASRHLLDIVWVLLAGIGVALLTRGAGPAAGRPTRPG